MPVFDTEEYVEALKPPVVAIKGRTYVGRILSIDEWIPLQPRARRAIQDEASLKEMRDLCLDYCRLAFPDSWYRLFWGKSTARKILELPPAVMMKALASFFACQGAAMLVAVPEDRSASAIPTPRPATS